MRGSEPNWRTPEAATGDTRAGLLTLGSGAAVDGVGIDAAGDAAGAVWAKPLVATPSANVAVTKVRKLSFKRSLIVNSWTRPLRRGRCARAGSRGHCPSGA